MHVTGMSMGSFLGRKNVLKSGIGIIVQVHTLVMECWETNHIMGSIHIHDFLYYYEWGCSIGCTLHVLQSHQSKLCHGWHSLQWHPNMQPVRMNGLEMHGSEMMHLKRGPCVMLDDEGKVWYMV